MLKHLLKGSERKPMPGAKIAGPADPAERLEVTILLRRGASSALQERVARVTRGDYSIVPMTREAFAATHGASAADIDAVRKFAAAHNLSVIAADAARRSVVLSGTVASFSEAFGVTLKNYDHAEGTYRGREGGVNLPGELQDIVQAVLGLDNRPQARAHFRLSGHAGEAAPAAAPVSYSPLAIASLYGFPDGTGAGQTIGIIELGGGTRASDLTKYFQSLGLKAPKVVTVSVDHGRNHATGSADGPDGEVMLDVEVAGAVAPAAEIVVYFTPNTDAGFLDAITTAIHDTTHKPSIVSISWGGPESSWTAQSLTAFDEAFQAAAAMGITVCVAAGDNGSTDGVAGNGNNVDFPASSPHVLACGGTSLQASGNRITSETVWNDGANGGATGGGISATFAVPTWQSGLAATLTKGGATALSFRGVPDVAGDADPETGYDVRVDGSNTVIGGTSAVAPLWAGLIARLNAARGGSIGFINPLLYANPGALNDITAGNNGAFAAAKGWDACTGLGSPNGKALATLLTGPAAKSSVQTVTVGDKELVTHGNKPAATDDALMFKGNALMFKGNAKAAVGKAKADPDALMFKGNEKPAGKVKDKALMIKGNAEPASGAKLKDDALMFKGNKKTAGKSEQPKVKDGAL
jgi:kumamolisin